MDNNKKIINLYNTNKKKFNFLILNKELTEESILDLINNFYPNEDFKIKIENNYNLNKISELFRFYENELKNSFFEDKNNFQMTFKLYLLLIELFTELIIIFSSKKENNKLIKPIFQILKESKTMLKFSIPFEEKELKIINNIIGEQLYYFSHIHYINTKNKNLNYLFEEYFLTCERIQHGFELSLSTNFADNPNRDKKSEELIFINNLSFLLLKMIYKLNHFYPEIDYFHNNYFKNILNFFKIYSLQNKDSTINSKELFHKALLNEFKNSALQLKSYKKIDVYKEKTALLVTNTDEYKELIDIILSSK